MAQTLQGLDAKDVSDFHFRQMTRYQLQEDNEHLSDFPKGPIQRLTVSNKLGKLFAGCHNSLVAVDISELEKRDEVSCNWNSSTLSANKKLKVLAGANDCKSTTPLPSTPTHLSINAEEKILAVALTIPSTGKPLIYLFDTRSFSSGINSPSNKIKPFIEIPSQNPAGVNISEMLWNPVHPAILSVVYSDGSLALYMPNEKGFDTATLPAGEKIRCVSWSPKGKQLVAGKEDGSLVQYKPDLKEAKRIAPPNAPEPGKQLVASSISWVSTYQFLVLYKISNAAYLYVVQSSKSGDTKYFNYDDICYSTGETRDPYFMMYQQIDWPLTICASANGIEVAVMGISGSQDGLLQQWNLEDSGRAEIPLVPDTNDERYPVGMAFCVGGITRRLPIDEVGNCMSHSFPILFLLAADGLLCGYYVAYQGGAQVTKPLENISGPIRPGIINIPCTVKPTPLPNTSQHTAASVQTAVTNLGINYPSVSSKATAYNEMSTPFFSGSGHASQGLQHNTPSVPILASTPIRSTCTTESPLSKTDISTLTPLNTKANTTATSNLQKDNLYSSTSIGGVKTYSVEDKNNSLSKNSKSSNEYEAENTYQVLIIEEVLSFEKELLAFRKRAKELRINVGTQDEKVQLKKGLTEMEGFRKLLIETTSSQCREISQLKMASLENCQWLEEAKSRQTRNRDPRYLQLLKGRALDPHSQKRLAKVQSKYMYLDQQINEINNKLDLEWEAHCRKTNLQVKGKGISKRNFSDIAPSMESIYRVLHNNHSIIEKQKTVADQLIKSTQGLKIGVNSKLNTSKPSRARSARITNEEELSRLAESFAQNTSLCNRSSNNEYKPPKNKYPLSPIIGFSPEKESKLKQLLAEKGTTKISSKPHVSQSMSTSNSITTSEKVSKNLLSSLEQYKQVNLVEESPKKVSYPLPVEHPKHEKQSDIVNKDSRLSSIQSPIPIASTKPSNMSSKPTISTELFPSTSNTSASPKTTVQASSLATGFGFIKNTESLESFKENLSPSLKDSFASGATSLMPTKLSFDKDPLTTKTDAKIAPLSKETKLLDASSKSSIFSSVASSSSLNSSTTSLPKSFTTTSQTISINSQGQTIPSAVSKPFELNSKSDEPAKFSFMSANANTSTPQPKNNFETTLTITPNLKNTTVSEPMSMPTSIFGGNVASMSNKLPSFSFATSNVATCTTETLTSTSTVTSLTSNPKIGSSVLNVADFSKPPAKSDVPTLEGATKPNTAAIDSTSISAASNVSSVFGKEVDLSKTSKNLFSAPQTTGGSVFSTKEKESTSIFGSGGNSSGTSIFAGTTTTSNSVFGNVKPTSSPSPIFGGDSTSTASSIFGTPAKTPTKTQDAPAVNRIESKSTSSSIFGGSAFKISETPSNTTSASSSIFGGNAEPKPTSTASNTSSIFGGGTTLFSGLGSAPSTDASSKNVFGGSTGGGSIFGGGNTSSNLFGNPAVTAVTTNNSNSIFGTTSVSSSFSTSTKPAGIFGSFSSTKSNLESPGFGATSPQSPPSNSGTHSFGAAPAFGASPAGTSSTTTAFGAASAFGTAPAFGTTPAFGTAPAFGGTPAFGSGTSTSIFGGAAASNVSTFGAIGAAASSGAPTFGSIGGQQSGSTFGSLSTQPTAFGGAAASTAGGFGGFGSPPPNANPSIFGGSSGGSSTSPGGASFNSWR